MVDPRNGWLGIGIQGVVATIAVAIVAMGCASSQSPLGVETGSLVQTIGNVSVARDGDGSIIRLEGLVDPVYSVTTPDDPNVVVVDLVGVGKSDAESLIGAVRDEAQQIAAYDGVVDLVTVSTFNEEGGTPLTRVEIVMADAGYAQVFSTGDGLEIRVSPGTNDTESGNEIGEMAGTTPVWDEAVAAEASAPEPWQAVENSTPLVLAPAVSVGPPPAATQLMGVSAVTTDGGVLVALQMDGGIGAVEAFTLEDPTRLVIDLPGLTVAGTAVNIDVYSGLVTGVRVGGHDGKVRVVVDGGPKAADFQGRQVMPGTLGLWVAIGDGEALDRAMNEALAASESAWVASATPSLEEPVGTLAEETDPAEAVAVALDTRFEEDVAIVADTDLDGETAVVADALYEEEVAPVTETVYEEELASAEDVEAFVAVSETAPLAAAAADVQLETFEEAVELTAISMDSVTSADVYGLHYQRADGLDRIAILSDDSVAYSISEPDATTLVVRIPNARISEAASDRIFPKAGGPVSLIHAFQQPEVDVPEVRVVFTRAPNQDPVVSRRGSMLFVDFADLGVAAAAPPAFPNAGATEVAMGSANSEEVATTPPTVDELAGMASEDAFTAESTPVAAEAPVLLEVDPISPVASADALIEVVTALPGFEGETALSSLSPSLDGGAPASMWDAPVSVVTSPAAVEVPAAIEVLEEGGLIDGKEYRGRRVSLDFKDVAIADVLRLIAEVSDLNIITGDEVSGNVTIRLVEVPWDQALDVILMTKGLGFVRVGNVLRIAPSDVLKAEEEVRLQERRNKEKLEDLEVKLLPVNYASVKDMEGLVKRLLSARGTVNLDKRTNTLIIKDISSVIDEASALIAAIDTQTPQVMIEAKIVEANLDFTRELGSVWGIQTQSFTDPFDPDTPRRDLGSQDLTFIDSNSLAFGNPITAVPTGLMTLGALILDQDFRIDTQIQAAESTGDGKVISSPRIVTLDNKQARIEQGVSIPFQTFEGGDAKLEFIDAVLSLIVTPHITADESIIMEIQITRNAPDSTVPTPTGSPAISKNVAETETLVKDGQTLVLGGIYTITKSKTQSRVPYLHRIPVIGNAFKNNSVTDNRKELLVFVTPRIVRLPEMASN